ncbi:hypothetical protein SAMN05660226_02287 [Parapedobacter luteus]|uniref:Uncharacterized protein n=1 Tax=Parapedobacter luteus TaxID=623280 RepID=A0A1T5CSH2_9SPHI|nr:hypothetical protein SAMN05660226_02287 [Parapedobacter luteus]
MASLYFIPKFGLLGVKTWVKASLYRTRMIQLATISNREYNFKA